MRHHFQYKDFVTYIKNPGNESVFVPADVEHDAVSNGIGRSKIRSHVGPILPITMLNMRVPSQ
jgi:hypothetical protein